jgi:hypothetical protein
VQRGLQKIAAIFLSQDHGVSCQLGRTPAAKQNVAINALRIAKRTLRPRPVPARPSRTLPANGSPAGHPMWWEVSPLVIAEPGANHQPVPARGGCDQR